MNGNTNNERILKRYLTEQDNNNKRNNGNSNGDEKKEHGLINQAVVNRLTKFIVTSLDRDKDACQSRQETQQTSSSLQRVTLSLKRRLTTLKTADRDNKKKHDTDEEGFGGDGEITKLCSKAVVKLLTSNLNRSNSSSSSDGPKIDEHLLKLVQNQRSMYLIGSTIQFPSSSLYTNTRFQQHNTSRFQSLYNTDVPMIDSIALTHFKPIILNYIKSDTCYEQLKPIAQNQLMSNQPTEIAANHLLVHTLAPLIQPTLNTIIKNSVIQFLNNTNIRQMTKQRIINTTSAVAGINTNPPTVLVSSVEPKELNKTKDDNDKEIIPTTTDNQETTTTIDKTSSSSIESTTTDTKDKIPRTTSTKQLKNDDEDNDTSNEDEIEPPEFI